KLIGSRARYHLYLPRAASRFGVNVCSDDAHFLDKIRARKGGRKCAEIIAPVRNDKTVARRIHHTETPAGEVAFISRSSTSWSSARCDRQKVQHIAASQREIAHCVIGQYGAHGGRGGRDGCLACLSYFNGLRYAAYL